MCSNQKFHNILIKTLEADLVQMGEGILSSISTDTRKIKEGEAFLTLPGENFDAHQFIEQAVKSGASAVICQKGRALPNLPANLWIWQVENPLFTYQAIAKEYLKSKKIIKIALTGTSGKTTTKEFLRALLAKKYNVFATKGNLNNQVGVALSALSVSDEDLAIFELGAGEPGDIAKLRDIIEPDYVLVSSVGEGHLEFFKNIEGVAKEKSSILKDAKKAFCPVSINCPEYFKDFDKIDIRVFDGVHEIENGYDIVLGDIAFDFPYWGIYQLQNFSLAVALAKELGVSEYQIASAVRKIELPSFRQEMRKKEQATFYLDCYNSNPLALKTVIKAFAQKEGHKILVLGDMLELGENGSLIHKQIGEFLNGFEWDEVFFYGEQMCFAFESFKAKKQHFESKKELSKYLKKKIKTKISILIKASRGMRLEEVFELL